MDDSPFTEQTYLGDKYIGFKCKQNSLPECMIDIDKNILENNIIHFEDKTLNAKDALDYNIKLSLYFKDKYNFIKGTKVAICGQNNQIIYSCYHACLLNGSLVFNCVQSWDKLQLFSTVINAEPEYFIVDQSQLNSASLTINELEIQFPNIKILLANNFIAQYDNYNINDYIVPNLKLEDALVVMQSSGSTATPKGIILTHMNILQSNASTAFIYSFLKIEPGSFLTYSPFGYIIGYFQSIQTIILKGISMLFMEYQDKIKLLEKIEQQRVETISSTPFVIYECEQNFKNKTHDLSSLKMWGVGGQSFDYLKIREIIDAYNPEIDIKTGYGMTEMGGSIIFFAENKDLKEDRFRTGKPLSLPVFKWRLENKYQDENSEHEVGEVAVNSLCRMAGYYNDEELTKSVITQDGQYLTGDLAQFNNGFLYIIDRIKDIVIHKGYNISTLEIEKHVSNLPGVNQVVVVGEKHNIWGEIPVAAVKLSYNVDKLMETVNSQLSQQKHLHKIYQLQDFPVLPGFNKIDKRAIRNLINEGKIERIDNNPNFQSPNFINNIDEISNVQKFENQLCSTNNEQLQLKLNDLNELNRIVFRKNIDYFLNL